MLLTGVSGWHWGLLFLPRRHFHSFLTKPSRSSDHSRLETRGSPSGRAGVPALFGVQDFAEASAKRANKTKARATIAALEPNSARWPHQTGRVLRFLPGPGSRLFCMGNMKEKLMSRVRANYHTTLWGQFRRELGDAVLGLYHRG